MASGNLQSFGFGPSVEVEVPEEDSLVVEETVEEIDPSDSPSDRISRLRENFETRSAAREGNVSSQVQRDMDALKGSVDGRLDDIRDELRRMGTPEESPEAGPAGINFSDPNVGEAFREVYDSEDPAAFGRAVGAVVQVGVDEVRRELTGQMDEFRTESVKANEVIESDKNFASNMGVAIPHIRSMGEPEDAIVEDYIQKGRESFLGQYLSKYPSLAQDVEGIVGAAMSVARMVEVADARLNSTPAGEGEPAAITGREVRTEAAPPRGSNRSVQRIKDDAKGKEANTLTPGEALKKSIVEASASSRGLPRVFH